MKSKTQRIKGGEDRNWVKGGERNEDHSGAVQLEEMREGNKMEERKRADHDVRPWDYSEEINVHQSGPEVIPHSKLRSNPQSRWTEVALPVPMYVTSRQICNPTLGRKVVSAVACCSCSPHKASFPMTARNSFHAEPVC